MRFDILANLSVSLGEIVLSLFYRHWQGLNLWVQNWSDRNLLVSVIQHPVKSASEFCQYPHSPHSKTLDEFVGSVVRDGETLAPLNVFELAIHCDQTRSRHALKSGFG
ncbi:MAG: hypothetical protein QNJ46_14175 [Leptolyngbyaceae cyanobacterium MO_188.B28]|nr:hypothetical protein [Leptolyngbyaceae cyanobacterium MO_188.B28]